MIRILLAWTAAFGLFASPAAAGTKAKPNILLIYTDDHSHRAVGCYPEAYAGVKTPAIDGLARSGIRFEAAYNGSWCAPSRATILTGLHPFGVESMRFRGTYPSSSYDPAQCKFWPEVFRRHGYFTGQIGKWHTGTDAGFGRDWDYQRVWNRPKFPDDAGNYFKPQLVSFNGAKETLVEGYPTDNYSDWAVDFIQGKTRASDKPWFLWVCYGATHGPYTPAERHKDAYPNAKVTTPADIYGGREGKPKYVQEQKGWVKGPKGEPVWVGKGMYEDETKVKGKTLAESVRQYNQCAIAIDEGVAKILKALEDSGQLENTLIVFTSDQGFAWGQHGFRHKVAPYDSNIRSPLIISWKGQIPAGKTCPVPVSGVDFAPTFFKTAGFDLPWKMHGRDLTPLLKDPTSKWDDPMMITHTGRTFGSDTKDLKQMDKLENIPWWISIRMGKMKYIRTLVENEVEELYDLTADPEELKNLAVLPEHRETLARMREQALGELRRTNAPFVNGMPVPRTAMK